jgi:transposase-like protein
MMARASPELKAAALADLAAGEQPAVVAERYGLSRDVVKMWKQRHVTDPVTKTVTSPVTVQPKVIAQQIAIGELILDLLRAKLQASAAIAEAARNPAWLAEQPAAELAALGQWLDASAFAIGDRLAGAVRPTEPGDDAPGT